MSEVSYPDYLEHSLAQAQDDLVRCRAAHEAACKRLHEAEESLRHILGHVLGAGLVADELIIEAVKREASRILNAVGMDAETGPPPQ